MKIIKKIKEKIAHQKYLNKVIFERDNIKALVATQENIKLKLAYVGIAYELIVMGEDKEAVTTLNMMGESIVGHFRSEMERMEITRLVFTVVIDFMNSNNVFTDSYFFKLLLTDLKLNPQIISKEFMDKNLDTFFYRKACINLL